MGEAAGVPWSIFISVSITIFSFIIAVGIIALNNKTTLASENKHINEKFIEIKVEIEKKQAETKIDIEKIRAESKMDIEKLRAEHKLDTERTRTDHKIELDKIRDKKAEDTIFFAESLSKLNTVLTRFEVNMSEFKSTMSHTEKTLDIINNKLEKHSEKINVLEREGK